MTEQVTLKVETYDNLKEQLREKELLITQHDFQLKKQGEQFEESNALIERFKIALFKRLIISEHYNFENYDEDSSSNYNERQIIGAIKNTYDDLFTFEEVMKYYKEVYLKEEENNG